MKVPKLKRALLGLIGLEAAPFRDQAWYVKHRAVMADIVAEVNWLEGLPEPLPADIAAHVDDGQADQE